MYMISIQDTMHFISQAEKMIKSQNGVSGFFYALKRFDGETFIHSNEVARLAILLAKNMNFTNERIINLAVSGYLHDVGKIFTGIDIIGKQGSLTAEEYEILMEHPSVGYRHLKNFIEDEEILLGILQHHERMNGNGYVKHLHNDEISEFGRIIAVADVFSAMTSIRPYKKAISPEETINYMVISKGFDENILSILNEMYLDGKVGTRYDSSIL